MSAAIAFPSELVDLCRESRCSNFGRDAGACRGGHYGQDDGADRAEAEHAAASSALWAELRSRAKPSALYIYEDPADPFTGPAPAPGKPACWSEWVRVCDQMYREGERLDAMRARRIVNTQFVRVRLAALEDIAECCRNAEVLHVSREMSELSNAVRAIAAELAAVDRWAR